MLKQLLLSVSLLLPVAAGADGPPAGSNLTKKPSKPSATVKHATGKPAAARAGAMRHGGTARPATAGQAAPSDSRMAFLRQFADADDDGNGLLSRQEAERNLPAIGEKFDSADASSDGWLTPEELRSYLQASRQGEPHG